MFEIFLIVLFDKDSQKDYKTNKLMTFWLKNYKKNITAIKNCSLFAES